MQSETGFPSSHQLKSYIAFKSRLKLAARAVLSTDAGLLVPIVDTCLSCEDIAQQSCVMVPRWQLFRDFLRSVFSASHMHHVSDLHPKFALRPHHVWKYIQSAMAEIRPGKTKKEEEEQTRMWANAQRDGRPYEHRWRPLFNAAKFG